MPKLKLSKLWERQKERWLKVEIDTKTEQTKEPDKIINTEVLEMTRQAVARGWCDPTISHRPMDAVIAEAVALSVAPLVESWYDTAAQHANNEEYYRNLLIECGVFIGGRAYIDDAGNHHPDVLCAKIPQLVKDLATKDRIRSARGEKAS